MIPTFNGRDVLATCLRSVTSFRPADSEVIVVDDASDDGTSDWVQAEYPAVRLIRLPHNGGFCRAVNAGIRAARAPVIETLNNDTVVTAGWAERALELFDDPGVGAVAPLVWLLLRDGLIDSAGDTYHISGWAQPRGHQSPPHADLMHVAEVFGASASAAFYRREALERVGGFPEPFGSYYDDVDLAFRLRWAGYRCLYTPHAQVFHRLNHSHNHRDPALVAQMARNEERVFWANLPGPLLRRGTVHHLTYVAYCTLSRMLRRDNLLAYLRGKMIACGELRDIVERRRALARIAADAIAPPRFPTDMNFAVLVDRARHGLRSFLRRRRAPAGPAPSARPARARVRRRSSARCAT